MLSLSLRPFYLPREFPTLVFTFVYIPPSANSGKAEEVVTSNANALSAKYPDAPLFILGDFNTCRLEGVLPSFQQFVEVPTRRDSVLDLCYGYVNSAYSVSVRPPLGSADQKHNFPASAVHIDAETPQAHHLQ